MPGEKTAQYRRNFAREAESVVAARVSVRAPIQSKPLVKAHVRFDGMQSLTESTFCINRGGPRLSGLRLDENFASVSFGGKDEGESP